MKELEILKNPLDHTIDDVINACEFAYDYMKYNELHKEYNLLMLLYLGRRLEDIGINSKFLYPTYEEVAKYAAEKNWPIPEKDELFGDLDDSDSNEYNDWNF